MAAAGVASVKLAALICLLSMLAFSQVNNVSLVRTASSSYSRDAKVVPSFPFAAALSTLLEQQQLPLSQRMNLMQHLERVGLNSESSLAFLAKDFVDHPEAFAKLLQTDFDFPPLVAHQARAAAMALIRSGQEQQHKQWNVSLSWWKNLHVRSPLRENETISLVEHYENNRTIAYVHVGKSGGLSLDRLLRSNCEWYRQKTAWKAQCFQNLPTRPSRLSNLTTTTVHLRARGHDRTVLQDQNVSLLWTIRAPLDRAISSFHMKHPDNNPKPPSSGSYTAFWRHLFYQKCFPTVTDLARTLRLPPFNDNTNASSFVINVTDFKDPSKQSLVDCRQLGIQTLQGHGHELVNEHLLYNYQHYFQLVGGLLPEQDEARQVLVLRTEHLWDDAVNLNRALGGRDDEIVGLNITNYRYQHGSDHYKVRWKVDDANHDNQKDRATLCCYLWHENELYETLVRHAANLRLAEKEQTLQKLYSDCGVKASPTQMSSVFNWSAWKDQSELC